MIDVDDYARAILALATREGAPFRGGVHVGYREGLSLDEIQDALCAAHDRASGRWRLRLPMAVASALAAIPTYPTRRAETIYQLFAQDHLVGVDRLAGFMGEDFVARDPREVLAGALRYLLESEAGAS